MVDASEESKTPVLLYTYANGAGKSKISEHFIPNIVYGPQNGWFDFEIFRRFPYPRVIWYVSNAPALKDTVIPGILSLLKPGTYTTTKGNASHITEIIITWKGKKWQLMFKTFDQDPKVFESTSVGLIILDEPAPKEIFDACKSRRRLGCIMLLPQTPLYTPPYVVDDIMAAADEGKLGYRHLTADLYAASRKDGIRGHLDPEIIESMVADYDPEEIEARVYGRQMYYSGAIYPGLYREKHFVEPEDFPVEPYSIIMQVVDPHDSRESAVIWIALGPSGRYIVIAEAPIRIDRPYWDMSRSEDQGLRAEVRGWIRIENSLKEKFRNIEGVVDDMGRMKVLRIMDRHFGWQTRGQRTLAGMYQAEAKAQGRKDFSFIKSYTASGGDVGEVQYGHMMVRKVYSNVLADERPSFVIWNTCYHTWNGLTHYIKRRRTGKLSDDHAKTDGIIVPKFTDFADATRYGVCAPMIKPTTPEELTIHQERFAAVREGKPFDQLTDGKKPWLR